MAAVLIAVGELNTGTRTVVRTSTGDLYAVFEDGGDVEVWYSADGSSWAQKDAGNSPACKADSPVSVAIDSGDILHIVYYDDGYPGSGGLNYITFDTLDGGNQDDLFNIEEEAIGQVDADNITFGCAIAIDSSNKPHAVFVDSDSAKGTDYDTIYYSNKTGVNWKSAIEIEGVSNSKQCRFPDITLDADDKPEIAYFNDSDDDIGAAVGDVNDASTFTLWDIETSAGSFSSPTITVDSSGNTWVGYRSGTFHAALRKHNYGDNWNTWQDELDSGTDATYPSIAIDGTDVYVFHRLPVVGSIAYEKYTGSWAGQTILDANGYGNVKAKWAKSVDNDSEGAIRSSISGYFNGAVVDNNNSWNDDANIADGDPDTYAEGTASASSDWISISGTNLVGNSLTIKDVFVRLRAYHSATPADMSLEIKNGAETETLWYAGIDLTTSETWCSWKKLTAPSGGWNLNEVQNLVCFCRHITVPPTNQIYVSKIEIMILMEERSATELDYLFEDGTNVYWNKLILEVPPVVPKPTAAVGNPLMF